ncbi:MAG: CsgG/HfaB family protein [Alphaproteobacteria bacterium]
MTIAKMGIVNLGRAFAVSAGLAALLASGAAMAVEPGAGAGVQLAQISSDGTQPKAGEPPKGEPPAPVLTGPVPEITGPKRTVAVGKFDSIGSFNQKYGNWDIGGGLAAMMTTALVESARFIVVERAHLQQVLAEQELKGNKLTASGSGPDLGRLVGVQFLVYGAVTEFGSEDSGGGMSLGFMGGGLGNLLSGAVSKQTTSGKVAMDFRVVDTTSGRVVETHKVSQPIENSGIDLSVGYRGMNIGGNQFANTPLGMAARKAITEAVSLVARDAAKMDWTGQVVDFDAGEIVINAGATSGLKKGDIFVVERVTKRLTDPSTGEILSVRKKSLGIVEVDQIEPKVASGKFQPLEPDKPERGDYVTVMKK